MNKIKYALLLIIPLLFVSCSKKNNDFVCFSNIDDAKVSAEKNNQDIIVIVTADEDDYYSHDFITGVMTSSEFCDEIAEQNAIVHFDLSHKTYARTLVDETASKKQQKETQAFAALMEKNLALASLLGVKNTPAFYLLTKEEYFISELTYENAIMTGDQFKQLVASYQTKSEEINSMVQKTKVGTNEEKLQAIDALYEATPDVYGFFLYDLIQQVFVLDRRNKNGLYQKYLTIRAQIDAVNLFSAGKAEEAAQKYIEVTQNKYASAEQKQLSYYMAASILFSSHTTDYTNILNYLKSAIDVNPEGEYVPAIQAALDSLVMSIQQGMQSEMVQ